METNSAEGRRRNRGWGAPESKALLESIPDFALIFGTTGRPVAANSAALRMLGKSLTEFSRMSPQQLRDLLQPDEAVHSADLFNNPVARALAGETVRHVRRTIRRPDTGAVRELSISSSPICNRRGQVAGVLVVAHEITELSVPQPHLQEAERHQAIGQMAAALAHDFSNVLDTIGQAAAVLELSQAPQERQDMIGIIHTAVRRGAEIVSGVRGYLRTGTGDAGPVDVRQVLIETIELTRPLWQRAGVHLVTDLRPVHTVVADVADLRRAFTNLIINGIEAMPDGGELTILCSETNKKVIAAIRDTGTGIAPEHQGRIFLPYFTTKTQGTGLGLSGAQKILLGVGGTLHFTTAPGKGTTFTVELPVEPKKQDTSGGEHKSAA
jgi:two-component system, NtrC family, sensor histidine kinase AtoS